MNQKEKSLATRNKILETAGLLFSQKGFEAATMQDIMKESRLSKGSIYYYFKSKEEILNALNDKMLLENNPFDAVKNRRDLTGLEKMKLVMKLNQSAHNRMELSKQTVPLLKNPHMLVKIMESNRQLLSPFWLELIEEGNKDGSVHTPYGKEISELIPLFDLWLTPSIYPAGAQEILHKFLFIKDMLARMGVPLIDDEIIGIIEQCIYEITGKEEKGE